MMHSSFNQKNTLKINAQERARAKRRLLGSIVLLLIALIILFKISAHIEPIPIDSDIIEVRNTNPHVLPTQAPLTPQDTTIMTNNNPTIDKLAESNVLANVDKNASAPTANTAKTDETTVTMLTLANLKPRIVSDEIKSKPSPEDILEGDTDPIVIKRYYLQLIGLEDKEQILHLKKLLVEHGYNPAIQTVITPTTKVYRLRMGPYDSQSEANSYLNVIKDLTQQ